MTTNEIYEYIVAEKESGNYPELDVLNSTSKVAIWRLLFYIFAFTSKAVSELFESFKLYIEDYFAKKQAGTLYWWITEIKNFQYGDEIEFIDNVFKYPVTDTVKQIIKQVSLEVLSNVLLFKVAKLVGTELTALSTDEQTALKAYCDKIKFPGTILSIVSLPADDLKLNYRIYYSAEYKTDVINQDITNAVNNYINNIVFNGKFEHTQLTDELQKIKGVKFPIFVSGFGKPHESPDINYLQFSDNYIAASGYFKVVEFNIEYIKYNV